MGLRASPAGGVVLPPAGAAGRGSAHSAHTGLQAAAESPSSGVLTPEQAQTFLTGVSGAKCQPAR